MVSTASKVRLGITLSIHVAYFACIAWQAFKQINSLSNPLLWQQLSDWIELEDMTRTDHKVSIAMTCIGGILIVASPLLSYIIM